MQVAVARRARSQNRDSDFIFFVQAIDIIYKFLDRIRNKLFHQRFLSRKQLKTDLNLFYAKYLFCARIICPICYCLLTQISIIS